MYQTYMRVAVGQLRQQIETNKELIEILLLEPHTTWENNMIHTPDKEKKYVFTCRKGCCRFEV